MEVGFHGTDRGSSFHNPLLDTGKMKNSPYQLPQPFLRNTRQVLLDVSEFVKPTEDFDLQVGHKELLTK